MSEQKEKVVELAEKAARSFQNAANLAAKAGRLSTIEQLSKSIKLDYDEILIEAAKAGETKVMQYCEEKGYGVLRKEWSDVV